MSDSPRLESLSDEELGELVRNTAAFRAAAACAKFADGVRELRENDSLAFDRLVRETHNKQGTSVKRMDTTEEIVNSFLDVIEEHAALDDHPQDVAERATEEMGGSDE